MGNVTGFMDFERVEEGHEPVKKRVKNFREFVHHARARTRPRSRARAAWTAARRSATAAARSTTSFRTSTTWSIAPTGRWRSRRSTRPTTSPSSPAASVRRRARKPARSTSTTSRSASSRSSTRSSTAPGPRAGSLPRPPAETTGKKVAVVGSGPAGLAAAQQLARAGHAVTVFEKNDAIGGLLRYGIPDFKMEKLHIDRRVAQMQAEGRRLPHRRARRRAEGRRGRDRLVAASRSAPMS